MLNQKEEKIVRLIEMGGPTLPSAAAKAIETEVYLASAILSGLVQHNHLKISHLRVGSSPLYYKEGQEHRVRDRLFKELNDLEKKALDRMKQLGVAFPNDLFPQERVLLKELSDFVEHMTLKINDQEVDVWRHHTITDEELNKIIDEKINGKQEETVQEVEREIKEVQTEEPETIPELQEQIQEIVEPAKEIVEAPTEIQKEIQETQKEIAEPKTKRKSKTKEPSDFELKIENYLEEKGIQIDSIKRIKKGESIYKAKMNNSFGEQEILIKVKNKKKIEENDISMFYTECVHQKKQGILFIPQKLSKKTETFVTKHIGQIVKVIVM